MYLRPFCYLLLTAVLSTGCAQSEKNSTSQARLEVPAVDLHTAVLSGNLEAVREHIAAGSDINEKEPFGGSTPLISAATFGKTEIAEALINAGADLGLKNNDGSTALHAAAFFCRVEIVKQLIDAKADKTLPNKMGFTAREIVSGPFEAVRPIYEMLQQQLQPLGLELDLQEVEKTRPVIAMMLQE